MHSICLLYPNGKRVSKEFKTKGQRFERFLCEAREHYENGHVVAVYVNGRAKLTALSPRERELLLLRLKA